MATKSDHPIKRVRREFKKSPPFSSMHRFSGAKQFAHWVGCSESLIRNVEIGATDFSEKLAKKIEDKTAVSAEWLLSKPGADEPIRGIDGNEWSLKLLDIFSVHPDIGLLYQVCPSILPRVIAKLVEAELRWDFFNGRRSYSVGLLQRLFKNGFLDDSSSIKFLHDAIREDEAFKEKYCDCLNLVRNDSPENFPKREATLHLLKMLEPEPPPGSRIRKLAHCQRVPED